MLRGRLGWLGLGAVAGLAAACGTSAKETSAGTTGSGGAAVSASRNASSTTTSSAGGGGASSGSGTASGGASPGGPCANAADEAALAAEGSALDPDLFGCAQGSPPFQPPDACVAQRIGLSAACATCFGEQAECILQACVLDCGVAADAAPCTACVVASCAPALVACAGVDPYAAADAGPGGG